MQIEACRIVERRKLLLPCDGLGSPSTSVGPVPGNPLFYMLCGRCCNVACGMWQMILLRFFASLFRSIICINKDRGNIH